ncbi:MAG TPA: YggS family pyridoxal phosphate-dependent enzyme [Alphaproteobacteria bacterium]|nr:YggS family pyridoxal phosphate-dependent enzyme [Alphaproteobacteria bacterium]
MTAFDHVAPNLRAIRARIAAACETRVGPARGTHSHVELIAVSKTHPAEAVIAALEAGQRVFGENRVQEAAAKFPALRARWPDLKLHLIGPLQTNKVRQAVETCDAIQTLDRDKLAAALAAELARQGKRLDLFVQVNTGEEPQKAGVLPAEADAFIRRCVGEYKLPVVGLMCIPPAEEHPAPHFALLREIARRNDLGQLSMGMSGDYELAIQFGATHVRVGTAIFGQRESRAAE